MATKKYKWYAKDGTLIHPETEPAMITSGLVVGGTNVSVSRNDTTGAYTVNATIPAVESVPKLTTARTIGLDTAVTATATAFDGSKNISIPVTAVKEAYLSWGGKNFAGSYGAIDAAMVPDLGANRLAFVKAAGVEIEYSRNGGASWVNYGASDAAKVGLFSDINQSIYIGGDSAKNVEKSNYMVRVTVNTSAAGVYTALNKFVIYISTNGSTGCYCSIDARLQSDYEAGVETWKNFADKVALSGWSGYNVINISSITTYGNTAASQYGQVRFTFGVESHASTVNYAGLQVQRIFGFGGVGWTTPSTMAAKGALYNWDYAQNMILPASIRGTTNKASDLGTSSYQFNNLYLGGALVLDGKSLTAPTTAGKVASEEWVTAQLKNIDIPTIDTSKLVTTDTEQEITGHKTFLLTGGTKVDFAGGSGGVVCYASSGSMAARVRVANGWGGGFYAYNTDDTDPEFGGYIAYSSRNIIHNTGVVSSTFNFPKKTSSGEYTLATTSDIPDTSKFITSTQLNSKLNYYIQIGEILKERLEFGDASEGIMVPAALGIGSVSVKGVFDNYSPAYEAITNYTHCGIEVTNIEYERPTVLFLFPSKQYDSPIQTLATLSDIEEALSGGGGSSGGKKYLHRIGVQDQANAVLFHLEIISDIGTQISSISELCEELAKQTAVAPEVAFPVSGYGHNGYSSIVSAFTDSGELFITVVPTGGGDRVLGRMKDIFQFGAIGVSDIVKEL